MAEKKIGSVIRIIDNRTIIVNAGKDRLCIGDTIKVYEKTEPILDLDGTELCIYEYTKDILEVIDVDTKYSVCQKKEFKNTAAMSISPLLSKKEYIPLNVDKEDIQPFEIKNHNIVVGDPIKKA
ncbi:MAG: hypothetical protein ACOX1S_05515 [Anaerostipes sp.]|jgi:hypothetical protein|nr:hypothetical protein [Anaerostipes sp.]